MQLDSGITFGVAIKELAPGNTFRVCGRRYALTNEHIRRARYLSPRTRVALSLENGERFLFRRNAIVYAD